MKLVELLVKVHSRRLNMLNIWRQGRVWLLKSWLKPPFSNTEWSSRSHLFPLSTRNTTHVSIPSMLLIVNNLYLFTRVWLLLLLIHAVNNNHEVNCQVFLYIFIIQRNYDSHVWKIENELSYLRRDQDDSYRHQYKKLKTEAKLKLSYE